MAKASGSIDLNAMKEASKVATNCLFEVTNGGVWLTPIDKKPNTDGSPVTSGNNKTSGTLINADGVGIYKDGTKVAQYGEDVTIGVADGSQSYAKFDYHSMKLFSKNETNPYFHVSDLRGQDGIATLTETFVGDGSTGYVEVNLPIYQEVSAGVYTTSDDEPDSSYTITRNDTRYTINPIPYSGALIKIVYKTQSYLAKAFTFGQRGEGATIGGYSTVFGMSDAEGVYSVAEGCGTVASGLASHAEGLCDDSVWDGNGYSTIFTTASGTAAHAEGLGTLASGNGSHSEGIDTTASGYASHAEGYNTTASKGYSHAEGNRTTASGYYSHTEGYNTTASRESSHAEGYNTIASGYASHAEGSSTTASGDYSHVEGYGGTTASGNYSHAEGYNTTASGFYSHAEGYDGTTASGRASHAQNYNTIAQGAYQTAIGKFNTAQGSNNIANTDYAFIVGNGTSDTNRSNALAVDWNGTAHVHSIRSIKHSMGNPCSDGDAYEEILVGNMTDRARAINSNPADVSAWLVATIKALCQDHPGKVQAIFKGRLVPSAAAYFKICIYDTSTVNSSGMPQYAYGTYRQYPNHYWDIWIDDYGFNYSILQR